MAFKTWVIPYGPYDMAHISWYKSNASKTSYIQSLNPELDHLFRIATVIGLNYPWSDQVGRIFSFLFERYQLNKRMSSQVDQFQTIAFCFKYQLLMAVSRSIIEHNPQREIWYFNLVRSWSSFDLVKTGIKHQQAIGYFYNDFVVLVCENRISMN